MRQAVILAGGKGTRLATTLGGLPKPLADVGGIPLLGHQLALLADHRYDEAVLLVSYGADAIAAWLAECPSPLPVRLVDDGEPRGTAGAVLAALDMFTDEFLVLYADTMVRVDLHRFNAWHQADPDAAASLFVHPNDHPADSDLIELDGNDQICSLHSYPHREDAWLPNLVNAALYIVRREALRRWIDVAPPIDFGKDLFPRMLAAGQHLRGYTSPEYIKDAGTPARLERVRNAYANGTVERASLANRQRAVLIDRDGTLNRDVGHISRAEDLEVYNFAGPALERLNQNEWRTVLVTNQPVMARGEISDAEMQRVHARLDTELAHAGAFLDRSYLCPHHPNQGFAGEIAALKIHCDCRKPAPGLILRAADDLNLDLAECWFVGDSTADLGAAEQAGVSSILVETGAGGLDAVHPYEPGFTAQHFGTAVDFILDGYPRLADIARPVLGEIAPGQDWFVGGLARSGKSSLAATLVRELRRQGRRARVVHLDRWIRSRDMREPGVFGRFDMAALETAVRASAARERGTLELVLPSYYGCRRHRQKNASQITLAPGEVVIWEGSVAVELACRTGRNDHSIHVAADEPARMARLAANDARRGTPANASAATLLGGPRDEHAPINNIANAAAFRVKLDSAFRLANREPA